MSEEIEVTAEMISAGIEAACLFTPSEDDFEVMLPVIYRAMEAAKREAAEQGRRS
jgi:hypothetical protein